VLVVEPHTGPSLASAITEAAGTVEAGAAASAGEALAVLERETFDCLVIDLDTFTEEGFALLEELARHPNLVPKAVLAYHRQPLTEVETARLDTIAGYLELQVCRTSERLLELIALRLRQAEPPTPSRRRQAVSGPRANGRRFAGEKVLIVDDDVRNVFALTSVLEQYGLTVLYAENGREGIEVLERNEDVALVLMDIMMPEMDGYATMETIRRMPQFQGLPIIALTAKAMKGDRDKSLAAGATDYVTKPVDVDHLVSLMATWLSQA
jgi:CheY-like chemotaxis protein